MAVVGDDPAEVGLESWNDIKPKISLLAAKEGESRNSICTLQREQRQELESYGPGQLCKPVSQAVICDHFHQSLS